MASSGESSSVMTSGLWATERKSKSSETFVAVVVFLSSISPCVTVPIASASSKAMFLESILADVASRCSVPAQGANLTTSWQVVVCHIPNSD